MIYDEDPFRRRPKRINGEVKMTGEVRLDDGEYGLIRFRTQETEQSGHRMQFGMWVPKIRDFRTLFFAKYQMATVAIARPCRVGV
jgi:hypothetical protein